MIQTNTVVKLTAIYIGIFAIAVAAIAWLVFSITQSLYLNQTKLELEQELVGLFDNFDDFPVVSQISALERRMESQSDDFIYAFRSIADENLIVGNIPFWPSGAEDRDGWLEFNTEDHDDSSRAIAKIASVDEAFLLLAGRRLDRQNRALEQLRNNLLVISILATVFVSALGYGMGRLFTKRVEHINTTFRDLAGGAIGARVEQMAGQDEISLLSKNVNAALDQNEKLINNIRHVSDITAHQLLKPVGMLRTQIVDVQSNAAQQTAEKLDDVIDSLDDLKRTVQAVLNIAELESDASGKFETFDLKSIVEKVAVLYEDVAFDRGVRIDLDIRRAEMVGDEAQMTELVTNLVSNALKYTSENSTVRISIEEAAEHISLKVCDEGPGISEADFDKVFEPLIRLPATAQTSPGIGLGLSLVRAITRRHKGEIELQNLSPGLMVKVMLPRTARAVP